MIKKYNFIMNGKIIEVNASSKVEAYKKAMAINFEMDKEKNLPTKNCVYS
ncbi:hypothetical protein [Psychrobacillus lasiicapitis]|nr:hypothetical protein [Psychrobacillus lasiicapitis]GGA47438.1 hypothetical protein GCM10011384_41400 [Psychrobacillus lasiicapitis]